MITARFPLENAAEAYTLVDRGNRLHCKSYLPTHDGGLPRKSRQAR
jgi:hypothetical protein